MRTILLFIFLVYFPFSSFSQTPTFRGGVIAGLNFSQLEGEGITDFFGLNAGIMGTARLSKHWQVGVELLFSQNGEYIYPIYNPTIQQGTTRLNHIEIPVHIDFICKVFRKDYSDLHLNWGIAYARIFSHYVEDITGENISDELIYNYKYTYLVQSGLIYYFTPNWGFNLKATLPYRLEGLDWTVAARIIYRFS